MRKHVKEKNRKLKLEIPSVYRANGTPEEVGKRNQNATFSYNCQREL